MSAKPAEKHEPLIFTPKGELASACISGTLLLAGFILTHALEAGAGHVAGHACNWIALGIGLIYGGRAALEALRESSFDIDVLMFVGAVLAAWIGAPAEGALLLFLFSLSGSLEDLAMARTTRAVEALGKLMPTHALRIKDDGTIEQIAPEQLSVNDRVRVLPGESIPADARLVLGTTSVNQATLTGESQPRDVQVGDEVFAGTINVGNPVELRVTKPASQSSLQKIVELVTQAQQQREPVQQIIDKISQPYAIGVFVAAILTFLVFWLVVYAGQNLAPSRAAYTAITLLIVASPCALIISTPTATLAGISRAARGGVLFKGGSAIERLARLRAVAFDKTGTLTVGKPRLLEVHPVAWSHGRELLGVAGALEQSSTHPIASAILQAAQEQGLVLPAATDVKYITGRGVSGIIDGHEGRVGSLVHTQDLIPVCFHNRVREVLTNLQHQGQIAMCVAWNDQVAVLVLADAVRPGADCLVTRLHEQGVRPVVMLTGDNELTARKVAEALKLDEFHAQLLPGQKVEHVQRLKEGAKRAGGGVGVIGDGVNDAPALAAADVSLAIGSIGSDAALESADIVLLSDDLSTVPWATHLARRVRRTVKINLTFSLSAMGVMAVALIIASCLGVKVPLWMGVVGHEGGTLLVVAHSLWLLAFPGIPVCTCEPGEHEVMMTVEGGKLEMTPV
jgi:Cd2+/Zn2+-exporting ATPase